MQSRVGLEEEAVDINRFKIFRKNQGILVLVVKERKMERREIKRGFGEGKS